MAGWGIMSYLDSLIKSLEGLNPNCEYWDVRIEDTFESTIDIIDGEVVTCSSSPSVGAFVRVRKSGFWFYQAVTDLASIKGVVENLASKASPKVLKQTRYAPQKHNFFKKILSEKNKYSAVPLEQKLNLMKEYADLLKTYSKVASSRIVYKDCYKLKAFLNSVGTRYEYDFNQGGAKIWYTLKEDENLFEDGAFFYGSEFSQLKNQSDRIKSLIVESEKFLAAPAIKPGKYKVLLDPEVTGVFTHESFGHKSEADFMLGNPEALAQWKLGTKIASDQLSIVDYGGFEGTSGYCPVDDDGTPAQKNYLIKNGILMGRLHSYETAVALDEKPTGNSRAISFEWEPIVRMTSTYIEGGNESIESLIKRCEGVLLVEGVRHGSGLSTFTIAPTRGYFIGKNQEKTPVRLSVISGSVFETLNNIEAVTSDFKLHSLATGGCGKMEQWPLPVADGGPYILVKEMQVS